MLPPWLAHSQIPPMCLLEYASATALACTLIDATIVSAGGPTFDLRNMDDSDSDEEGRRLIRESHALHKLLMGQKR